jgi:hypothetical protein
MAGIDCIKTSWLCLNDTLIPYWRIHPQHLTYWHPSQSLSKWLRFKPPHSKLSARIYWLNKNSFVIWQMKLGPTYSTMHISSLSRGA